LLGIICAGFFLTQGGVLAISLICIILSQADTTFGAFNFLASFPAISEDSTSVLIAWRISAQGSISPQFTKGLVLGQAEASCGTFGFFRLFWNAHRDSHGAAWNFFDIEAEAIGCAASINANYIQRRCGVDDDEAFDEPNHRTYWCNICSL